MYKTIYAKSSNDRADKFCVITKLQIDETGKKRVKKIPATVQAEQHINQIFQNRYILYDKYKNTDIQFSEVSKEEDGIIISYVAGKSFEEYLDVLLEEDKLDECVETIKRYISVLLHDTCPFECSEECEHIFGYSTKGGKAVRFVDIDMLFSNVIYDGQKWIAYDFEWTFPFCIPYNYMIYRLIHYFAVTKSRQKVEEEIYKAYAIDEEEQKQYKKMEECFQLYILGGHVPMRFLYKKIHGEILDVKSVIEQYAGTHMFQVYYDYGRGYSERQSKLIRFEEYAPHQYNLAIDIPEGVQNVRIDPAWCMCVVEIYSIIDDRKLNVRYDSNGYEDETSIYFFNDDPQLRFKLSGTNISVLNLQLGIYMMGSNEYTKKVDEFTRNKFIKHKIKRFIEKLFYKK